MTCASWVPYSAPETTPSLTQFRGSPAVSRKSRRKQMRELTNNPNGWQRSKEMERKATTSTAITRLSENLNNAGWRNEATFDEMAPLVEAAWDALNVHAGTKVAQKAVSYVMQAFRTPDLANPSAFVEMAVGALEDFPPLVLAELASPKTGIVRDSKFPPSIAELVHWCEARLSKHKKEAERGSIYLETKRRAKDSAERQLSAMEDQRRAEAEWAAGEPERRRKAEEAEKLVKAAALKRAAKEAASKRESEARAAWMKAVFSRFADDAKITDRLCSLTDDEQDEATRRELEMPGTGSQWLAEKVTQ